LSILTILGWLFASFTVFTAISMFGVFLGTGAPIEDSLVLMADGVPGQQQPSVAVNYVFRSHADR